MAAKVEETRDQTPAPPYSPADPSAAVQQPQAYVVNLTLSEVRVLRERRAYAQHPQPVYVQETNYVIPLERLQGEPDYVVCPFCNQRAKTRVDSQESGTTL